MELVESDDKKRKFFFHVIKKQRFKSELKKEHIYCLEPTKGLSPPENNKRSWQFVPLGKLSTKTRPVISLLFIFNA